MAKAKEQNLEQNREDIKDRLMDELLANYKNPEEITGEGGLLKELTKRLIEKAMEKELTHHLGYEKHTKEETNNSNTRNGYSPKTVKGDFGEVEISTPRDRDGNFEPQILPKGERHFKGFDEKIISMYTRGMTTRDIQGHLKEIYGVDVSPELVSNVTEGVMEDAVEWQNRPLDKVYPILYLDGLWMKIKDEGHVRNKAIYLVMGVNISGNKELLGMWVQKTEGAKFWLQILTDLKNRGVEDIFIACVDGLKGFPEAINSIYPKTDVQLCVVHMVRNSLRYVPFKERKQVAVDLKLVYGSVSLEQAELELENFCKAWDRRYPTIGKMWKANWKNIIPFFAYAPEIRKVIYTTNAIESLNYTLRKIIKNRASFPSDESALKLLYLGMKKVAKKWTMPIRNWGEAINQFAVMYGDRVPLGQE